MRFKDSFMEGRGATVLAETIEEAGGTDLHVTEVDFGELPAVGHEFVLSAKLVTNATAPGGSKEVKVNQYWSAESIATASAAAILAARKTAGSALSVPNAADTTRHYPVAAAQVAQSRYLYLTLDSSALDAGAEIAATVFASRVS